MRCKKVECVHEKGTDIGEDIKPSIPPNIKYDEEVKTVEHKD